jgi:uncharacterized RDD family membrane protein YckC
MPGAARPTRWCPNGDGEFEARVTECLDCGATLVDDPPPPPPPRDHEVVDLSVSLDEDARRTLTRFLHAEGIGHEWRVADVLRVPRASLARAEELVELAGGTGHELPAHPGSERRVGDRDAVVIATFWERFGASIVDAVVTGVGAALFAFTGATLGWIVGAINEIVLVTLTGATVGKLCLRLRIIRYLGGGRVDLGRATVRWFVKGGLFALALLILGDSFIWLGTLILLADVGPFLARPDRRALHDLAAGSLVVRA